MTEVIGVRFKSGSKTYYFDPKGLDISLGTHVIIETARGIEFGTCTEPNHEVEDSQVVQPLRPVVRLATPEDEKTVAELIKKEKKAFAICEEKISKHGLDMKLVEVEYNFEGNKILFFFTSDGRVDFRELVKDLASVFRTRIELRQIGVRDEAKLLGGLGICGRPFCCSSFLDDFQPVSIKMAKTQNLSLNPTKISGTCGRLMCCLKYEQEAYEDLVRRLPKVNAPVETPDGAGTVAEVNLLREQVKVRFDGQPDKKAYQYDSDTRTCVPIRQKSEPESRFTSAFLSELLSAPSLADSRQTPEDQPAHRERSRRKRGGKGGDKTAAEARPQPSAGEHRAAEKAGEGEGRKTSPHRRRRRKGSGSKPAGEQTHQTAAKPQQAAAQNKPAAEGKSQQQKKGGQKQGGKAHQGGGQKQGGKAQPGSGQKQGGKAQPGSGQKQGGKPLQAAAQSNPTGSKGSSPAGEKPGEGGSQRRRGNNKYRGRASNRPPKTDSEPKS